MSPHGLEQGQIQALHPPWMPCRGELCPVEGLLLPLPASQPSLGLSCAGKTPQAPDSAVSSLAAGEVLGSLPA